METVDEHVLFERSAYARVSKWNARSTSDTMLSDGERDRGE